VAVGPELAQRKQQVQGSHDVVDLRENRVLPVDHGVWRGSLFGKMDYRIRLERLNRR
jgi:hypothetical protein